MGGGPDFNSLTELIEHYKKTPLVETSGTVINLKLPYHATSFLPGTIPKRVAELQMQNQDVYGKAGFWEEFEVGRGGGHGVMWCVCVCVCVVWVCRWTHTHCISSVAPYSNCSNRSAGTCSVGRKVDGRKINRRTATRTFCRVRQQTYAKHICTHKCTYPYGCTRTKRLWVYFVAHIPPPPTHPPMQQS